MNKEDFLALLWSFEEIMMHRDYLRNQIDSCSQGCGEEDEGLCPVCLELFEQVMAEDERLATNKELDAILKKLKKVCATDLTGEYQRILDKSRDGGVVH